MEIWCKKLQHHSITTSLNHNITQYSKRMYIILVYDIAQERVGKMLKLCRRYLNWIQNSVFEGELSPSKLRELKFKAEQLMDKDYDSLIIFSSRDEKWLEKEVIGKNKNELDTFL